MAGGTQERLEHPVPNDEGGNVDGLFYSLKSQGENSEEGSPMTSSVHYNFSSTRDCDGDLIWRLFPPLSLQDHPEPWLTHKINVMLQ